MNYVDLVVAMSELRKEAASKDYYDKGKDVFMSSPGIKAVKNSPGPRIFLKTIKNSPGMWALKHSPAAFAYKMDSAIIKSLLAKNKKPSTPIPGRYEPGVGFTPDK